MVDNANVSDPDIVVAADEIGGVKYQRVKVAHGVDGVATDASGSAPLPVTDAAITALLPGSLGQKDADHSLAVVLASDDTVPVSGPITNAELRASAVPISAAALPLPTGAATQATLAAIDTKLGSSLPLPTGAATDLGLAALHSDLVALLAKDFATQTTAAAILAKLIAAPATEATSAAILAKLIAAPATEATVAAVLAKIIASPATETTVAAINTKLASALPLPTGAATAASQATLNAGIGAVSDPPYTAGGDGSEIAILKYLGARLLAIQTAAESTTDVETNDSTLQGLVGSLTETMPATDTASSGLNGREQRVASNITTMSAKLPAALGAGGGLKSDGSVAHDAADAGEPMKIGGRARSSEIAAVANNDRIDFVGDLTGKQIVLPYANPENFVSGATAAMTGTASTSLIAAPAAGLRNYITSIIVSNSHATVGTDVIIQDGSGGTTLMTIPAASVYGGAAITLPAPLRQPTTATALYCANVTTGASVKVSAVGYKGA